MTPRHDDLARITMTSDALFDATPYIDEFSLADRFGVPPFSTLDTRSGRWRERRARWDTIELESREGRGTHLTFAKGAGADPVSQKIAAHGTTSTFDPVLTELIYRWWTPINGVILDPFAGGSVRGIVASILGGDYHGVDLSQDQVDANEDAAHRLQSHLRGDVRWYRNDSTQWVPPVRADAVVTCPPYGTLERYSSDPRDLSTMKAAYFETAYRVAINNAIGRLRNDRFAVFVVGNYREDGHMIDLVGMTVNALDEAGAEYYGDLVLLNATSTAALRASATFNAGRKPIMVHQHIVVAVKGDWRAAAAAAERVDPLDGVPDEAGVVA